MSGMSAADLARSALSAALDRVVQLNQAPVDAWINRVHQAHPGASPAQVIAVLERQYRRTVMGLGAASGAVAVAPGLSTGAGLATAPAEITLFLEATALFAHAVAEVHGVHVDDPERKRALILAVTLGEPGARVVEKVTGKAPGDWGELLAKGLPASSIGSINKALLRTFLTKYGTRQGLLVLGRAVPLGIGAVIGASGNAALAQASIASTRRAFGKAPKRFPKSYRLSRNAVIDGEVVAD